MTKKSREFTGWSRDRDNGGDLHGSDTEIVAFLRVARSLLARLSSPRYLRDKARHVLGLTPPGKSLKILPDDVFLVSFPKSGNTWTRFLLGNLMFPNTSVSFANVHMLVPCPLDTPRKYFYQTPRPRIIKSHDCFDPAFPRVIYIVRDPRDVLISQYHYNRKIREIDDELPIEMFAERFLTGHTSVELNGSWGENVGTWLMAREGDSRFLMLRYECLVSDTDKELRKIDRFLNLNSSSAQITQAVKKSSLARMQELEKAQGDDIDRMVGRESRKDLKFVRAGVSGGWRKDLPMTVVEKLEAAWGPIMLHLGYELATTQTLSKARLGGAWTFLQLRAEGNVQIQPHTTLCRA